ncbi:MAG: M15 family metallopeptidase [Bacteroidota bacterium]
MIGLLRKVVSLLFLSFLCLVSCKKVDKKVDASPKELVEVLADSTVVDSVEVEATPIPLKEFGDTADTTFVRLADYSHDFVYDMRYATTNNFLKEKVYDCAECYVRTKTAKALIAVNQEFMKRGVRIKFFDCYRPNSVQHKMWKILPNPQYVANPVKGSIHNKGGAIDITLVDSIGVELDMGTEFDFFGKEAHHDFTDLPETVLANRKLLKETMEANGFWGIRTEWWHYNLAGASKNAIADFTWDCPVELE